eukprot:Em0001g583a
MGGAPTSSSPRAPGDLATPLHGMISPTTYVGWSTKRYHMCKRKRDQQLVVMRYLEQLSDTQVAFSVRQKRPKTLAEAVALTLETESLAIASGETENSTTDINAQGLLTTLLQRMGKLEDTLAEARIHMPSQSPIVGCGKKRNYQEGHAHSQMSTTTQIDYATTPVLPINSSSAYKIPAFINNIRVSFLLDTAWCCCLTHSFLELLKLASELDVSCFLQTLSSWNVSQLMLYSDLIFIRPTSASLTHSGQLPFAGRNMTLPLSVTLNEAAAHVTLGTTLHLPPSSEIEVMAKVQEPLPATDTWIVEGAVTTRMPIKVAHGLVHVRRGEVPVRLLNPSTEPIIIHKGTQIATMEQVQPAELSSVQMATAANEHLTLRECLVREDLYNIVQRCGQGLTDGEKNSFLLLLQEYKDVFAVNKNDLGRTDRLRHSISTGNSHPIRQPLRRIPTARWEEARKMLEDMLHKDIIQPSVSPWASPVVLVPKKDGNTSILRGLPAAELHHLYLPASYGSCSSGMQWSQCLVYLDDIIIPGRSVEEHLRNVLQRLRAAGLKLQPAKCSFFQKQVKYLGLVISEEGVATDSTKTEKTSPKNLSWTRAVLSQVQEDSSEKVIAYGSRLMTKTERRYCATRCELLSVVTFVKQFHPYLLGRHFKLRTDHGSLVWLKNFKEPEGQLARWLERIQQYDFTIIHRRGRKHCNADAMSRIPCSQCGRSEPNLNEEELSCISMVVGEATEGGECTMRKLQLEDSEIGPLLLAIEAGVKPELHTVQSYTIGGRRLFQLWDQLYPRPSTQMQEWEHVCAGGVRLLYTLGEAYAIPNQEAETVAKKLTNEMFCQFSQLHSDQGRQFESKLVSEMCKVLKICKTPYHPQGDGLVERFNRTLISMLATATADHSLDWEECLPKVCFAYNTSVQTSTGYTPLYLMFGRQAKLPVDLMYGMDNTPDVELPEYVGNLKRTLQKAYEVAREHIGEKQQFQKELYNQIVHGLPFCVGDLVWLYSPAVTKGRSKKLHLPWDGPYRVIKRLSDANYCIQATMGRRRRLVVTVSRNVHLMWRHMALELEVEAGLTDKRL